MKKSEILWNEFIRVHNLYLSGYATFSDRARSLIKFKTAFIAEE